MKQLLILIVLCFSIIPSWASDVLKIKVTDPKAQSFLSTMPHGQRIPWVSPKTLRGYMVVIQKVTWINNQNGTRTMIVEARDTTTTGDFDMVISEVPVYKGGGTPNMVKSPDPRDLEEIVLEPGKNSSLKEEVQAGNAGSDSGTKSNSGEIVIIEDITHGLGEAATAAFIEGFQQALPYADKMKKAYEAIQKMQTEINSHMQDIENVRIDLTNSTISLNIKLKEYANNLDLPKMNSPSVSKLQVYQDQSKRELGEMKWQSQDFKFVENANKIRERLLQSPIDDRIDRTFFNVAKHSLVLGDEASFFGKKKDSEFYLSLATSAADVLLGLDPFTGFGRSLYETVTGENIVTGEQLSKTERALAMVGIITVGYGSKAYKVYKLIKPIARIIGRGSIRSYRAIGRFLSKAGHGPTLVGTGSTVRKINFHSDLDGKWGLTKEHLNKHFRGTNKNFSMKIHDPSGNSDKWMQNMVSLMQKKSSSVQQDGILKIYDHFPKSDGIGFYRMGIKLKPRNDGSFDLVTILTKQKD